VCQRWGAAARLAGLRLHEENVVVQKGEAENVFVQGDEKEKESGIADGSTEEVAFEKAKVTVAFLEPAAKVNRKGIVPVTGNGFDNTSRGGFGEEESNFQGTQACRGQGTEARRRWSEEPGFSVA
jgi:hypothetical protein